MYVITLWVPGLFAALLSTDGDVVKETLHALSFHEALVVAIIVLGVTHLHLDECGPLRVHYRHCSPRAETSCSVWWISK